MIIVITSTTIIIIVVVVVVVVVVNNNNNNTCSVLRQAYSKLSGECDLVFPFSIFSIFFFP